MRWFKEFFNPILKCKRLGHEFETVKGVIIKRSKDSRSVCESYSVDLKTCKRCEMKLMPKNEEYVGSWTSITMPKSMWKEMDEKGYVIVDD